MNILYIFTEHAFALFVGIAVVSFAFAVFLVFRSQRFKKKNKALEQKLTELNREMPNREMLHRNRDAETYQRIIRAVYDDKLYADQHMDRDTFAARMNLSRHALNRIISNNSSGQSFPQWINNIRIETGCEMLLNEPDKSVVDIAKEVGLTPNNFHRLFRNRYGMTPIRYRQQSIKDQEK